jgi:cation transport regulator ChaC
MTFEHDANLCHVSLKREQKQWAGGRQYLLDAEVVGVTFIGDPCHAHFACSEQNSPQMKIACLEPSKWPTSFEFLKQQQQQQQGVRRQQHDIQAAAAAAAAAQSARTESPYKF